MAKVFMSSLFLSVLLTWQSGQGIISMVEMTKITIAPHVVQVNSQGTSTKPQAPQSSPTIEGSQQPTTQIPYGKIFDGEESEPPFYLKPEFGGLDGSDHRRMIRPNAAGQRLDMDQYNKQVRPPVGP
ncbi:MAG: hypothetical protein NPIRA01_19110 [Nitrospirales bacterium]|nr:MAG: hypothetical protein NPIRA01_19110 [Nitrospirales bacterium]